MSKSNKMGVVQLTILTMVNMMGSGLSCCLPNWQRWAPSLSSPGW